MHFPKTALATCQLVIACGLICAGCQGGRSRGAPAPQTAPAATASPVIPVPAGALTSVAYRDTDGLGAIDSGDVLVLTFDRPVQVGSLDPTRDLLVLPDGSLGSHPTGRAGAAPNQVIVTLSGGATLALFDTYRVGVGAGPGRSPSRLALAPARDPGALRDEAGRPLRSDVSQAIVAEERSRRSYQGDAYTWPPVSAAQPYFGNLHAHSGYSDGQGTADDAFAYARDASGLDFMCLTDHAEQLSSDEWQRTLTAAATYTVPGRFVALAGYEWNWGVTTLVPSTTANHINVIGTTRLPNRLLSSTLWTFWALVELTSLPEGAVGQFNHPSAGVVQPAWAVQQGTTIENWNNLAYAGTADRLMGLMRVEGRGSGERADIGYLPALERGWHVSPQSSEDNHAADWGHSSRRTGVWLSALEGAELLRALREGRTFSSDDRNASIRLIADGECWMGSTIARSGSVLLEVSVADLDGEPFDRLELCGSGGATLISQPLGGSATGTLTVRVDPSTDGYYWAHAVQADGDELFSAPIYVDR